MRFHPFRSPAILFLSALILAGCAGSPGKLAVDLTALKECQRLGNPVKVPEIGPETDYRDLSAESLGQIVKANKGAAARTRCENGVIAKYAKAT